MHPGFAELTFYYHYVSSKTFTYPPSGASARIRACARSWRPSLRCRRCGRCAHNAAVIAAQVSSHGHIMASAFLTVRWGMPGRKGTHSCCRAILYGAFVAASMEWNCFRFERWCGYVHLRNCGFSVICYQHGLHDSPKRNPCDLCVANVNAVTYSVSCYQQGSLDVLTRNPKLCV